MLIPMQFYMQWVKTEKFPCSSEDNLKVALDGKRIILLMALQKDATEETPQLVRTPLQWMAELQKMNPSLKRFFEFVLDKIDKESDKVKELASYLLVWALCAILLKGQQSKGKKWSSLGIATTDLDQGSSKVDEWEQHHFDFLFPNTPTLASTSAPTPVVVNIPPTYINSLDAAYLRGVDAPKRNTETIAPTGTKYNKCQLRHLLGFCQLQPNKKVNLPKIWTTLQSTKD